MLPFGASWDEASVTPSAERMEPRVWLRTTSWTRGLFGLLARELALNTWMLLSWMNKATKHSTMKMPNRLIRRSISSRLHFSSTAPPSHEAYGHGWTFFWYPTGRWLPSTVGSRGNNDRPTCATASATMI